jgi:hypothetical protein
MFDRFSFGEVPMIDLSRVRGALCLAPVALTLAACDATAPRASHLLSLSVTTKRSSGVSLPAGSGMSAAIQVGSGANLYLRGRRRNGGDVPAREVDREGEVLRIARQGDGGLGSRMRAGP